MALIRNSLEVCHALAANPDGEKLPTISLASSGSTVADNTTSNHVGEQSKDRRAPTRSQQRAHQDDGRRPERQPMSNHPGPPFVLPTSSTSSQISGSASTSADSPDAAP